MATLDRQPDTKDYLSPLGFQFSLLKAPAINFFVQSVELPAISIGEADIPTPFSKLRFPGTQLAFSDLNITFKVDEQMQSYLEIYNWMKKLGFPDNFEQYALLTNDTSGYDGVFSDMSLIILSAQKNPIMTVTFRDAFPVNLGSLSFDATAQLLDLTVAVQFAYRSYDISPA